MKRYLLISALSALAFSMHTSAHAQLHVSAFGSKDTASGDRNPCGIPGAQCDSDTMGRSIRLGYYTSFDNLAPSLDVHGRSSIDLTYTSYGKLTTKGNFGASPFGRIDEWTNDLESMSLGTTYELPLYGRLSLLSRIGFSWFRAKEFFSYNSSGNGFQSSARNESHPYFALGLSYRLNQRVSFSGDYMATKAPYSGRSERDLRILSGGASYSF